MATTTLERINDLTEERRHLYSAASNGKGSLQQRIGELSQKLDSLWDARRTERAGRKEGIDLMIERSYQQIYGENFADAVAPPAVSEAEDRKVALAA